MWNLFAITFFLLFSNGFLNAQNLKILSSKIGFEIYEGSSPVLTYRVTPDTSQAPYDRPHYIHPLYNLEGEVITEDAPADHLHHHGLFTAWHQVLINDEMIGDAWMCENIKWSIKETNIDELNDRIVLHSVVQWMSRLDSAGKEQPILTEEMDLTIMESTNQFRIIDCDIFLKALMDDLKIGGSDDEKGYGGFSLRLKNPEDLTFYSGKIIEPRNTAVEALPWMNMFTEDGNYGVLVMVHPSNPDPTDQWILRNSKSMQNPVFPGRVPVEIDKEGVQLKYRVIVYQNPLEKKNIEMLYNQYIGKK